jgi:putative ABC transport system permease protein
MSVSTFFAAPLGLGSKDASKNFPLTHFAGYPRQDLTVRMNAVGERFVETLGAEIVVGRSFNDPQYSGRTDVAVINDTLARRLLPRAGGSYEQSLMPVVGREIQTEMFRGRIIGIIKDLVDTQPGIPADPQVFTRDLRGSAASLLAIRLEDSPGAQAAVHSSLRQVWGEFRRESVGRLSDEVERVLLPYRAQSLLLTLIAAFSVPIAIVGLAGALSYGVRTQSRELAVRIALGANPRRLRSRTVRDALVDVAVGIIAGTPVAILLGRLVAQQLLGVRPADAITSMGVALLLLSICWLAAAVTARDVSKLEPAAILKES